MLHPYPNPEPKDAHFPRMNRYQKRTRLDVYMYVYIYIYIYTLYIVAFPKNYRNSSPRPYIWIDHITHRKYSCLVCLVCEVRGVVA